MSLARDFSTRPQRRRQGLVLLVLSLLALGLAAQQALSAREARTSAEARLRRAREDAALLRDRLSKLDSDRGGGIGRQALLARVAPPPRVLADVVALLPEDVRLDGLDLSYGRRIEVGLKVVARRAAAYDEFLERLTASTRFASVRPGTEARKGEVRADVRAQYVTGEEGS